MVYIPSYENDGSGRDTFVNHAGAYWLNPLPGGTYHKSLRSSSGRAAATHDTMDPLGSVRPPGQDLFGKSRYGTTVLQGGTGTKNDDDGSVQRADGYGSAAATARAAPTGGSGTPFDPEATALATIPDDVAKPERRLMTPGHATTGLDGTAGGSTYTGTPDPWSAPRQVDNTLLRLKPTYESTCHFGLRTGRFYTPDTAPAPEDFLLDKSRTRYV